MCLFGGRRARKRVGRCLAATDAAKMSQFTLEKRAQRTDRNTKTRVRDATHERSSVGSTHGSTQTQSLRRLRMQNRIARYRKYPKPRKRSLQTEDPRGYSVGGRTWAKRRASSARGASGEHAPTTTQSGPRPFKGSSVDPHPATLACLPRGEDESSGALEQTFPATGTVHR